MVEQSGICPLCCSTPEVATDASQVFENNRNLTQYVFVSTIQAKTPGYTYKYKSQTERIQTLMGKLNNPQAKAMKSNGGQCK